MEIRIRPQGKILMSNDQSHMNGTGSIFRDLGFEKLEEELRKAELATRIDETIVGRSFGGLTQHDLEKSE